MEVSASQNVAVDVFMWCNLLPVDKLQTVRKKRILLWLQWCWR